MNYNQTKLMKKLYTFFLFSFTLLSASAQSSLSPHTKLYLRELEEARKSDMVPKGYIHKLLPGGELCVSTLIKVDNKLQADAQLATIGAHVGTKAGDIWTVQVPVNKVSEFIQLKGISYIQVDEPVHPNLDSARKTTRVDSVHAGYNLKIPYSGKNVVVGVIDFGFDYNHPDMWDTAGKQYRIKKVWELNTPGTPPQGYSYGHEMTDEMIIRAQETDNRQQIHGSCVAGMAAGSGYGDELTAKRFRGMAYDADMVFVGVRRDSIGQQWMSGGFSDFIDGIAYIFKYAESVRRPAVVNISWGSQSGAHNGTSLFNQACDNLSGKGKIIVMSAGNDGMEQIHLSKTFTATDTMLRTAVTFSPDNYKRTWVDVWGEKGKTFCAKVTLYKGSMAGNTTQTICLDNDIHDTYLLSGADTCYVRFINSTAEYNGKPRMIIDVFNKTSDVFAVTLTAKEGSIHMWNEYYYYGYPYRYTSSFANAGVPGAVGGNNVSTVSDMGSAKSVLLIGAYNSKVRFTNLAGQTANYGLNGYVAGGLSLFSSRGPMTDGRVKPDITAPGLTIATSVNSRDTAYLPGGTQSGGLVGEVVSPIDGRKYYYNEFTGTSAAAPAASGIVALMLQSNPYLTPDEAREIIIATAIEDSYTLNIPDTGSNAWGFGKINAYGAVKMAEERNKNNFTGNNIDCVLFPNPYTEGFMLDYRTDKADKLNVAVYGITGQQVAFYEWQTQIGINQHRFATGNLQAGMYIVKVVTPKGNLVYKTIKQ